MRLALCDNGSKTWNKMSKKEEIYKSYLEDEIKEEELIKILDSIQQKKSKQGGVIYTPWNVAQEMIKLAKPTMDMKIVEPSCGHGIFIVGLLSYMQKEYKLSGDSLLRWFKEAVVGIEISLDSVKELRTILSLYFFKNFGVKVGEEYFKNIICDDGLKFISAYKYDLCIGNPPYIRAKHMDVDYLNYLKKAFESCKVGTIDIYFAFIEKYLKESKCVVFITPNSFLTSKSGLVLRNMFVEKVSYLVDFKEKKIFQDASVYTCIFKCEEGVVSDQFLYGNDIGEKLEIVKKLSLVKNDNVKISNHVVLSGIATLCDKVFLVKKENNKFYAEYEKKKYEIESGCVVPYLKLTKIKSEKDLAGIDYMIYPYKDNKVIINDDEFKERFPSAYKYMEGVKLVLNERDKGKTEKYEKWYAYGRKQGLHNISSKEIIVIPQMIGGECRVHKIKLDGLFKHSKNLVFTSGFVVPVEDDNVKFCQYLLGEEFKKYAIKNGKVWPGKKENYYSLSMGQIKSINII